MPLPPDRSAQRRTRPAEPPRTPSPSGPALRRLAEHARRYGDSLAREHFTLLSGILWMGVAVLAGSLLRAGAARAFVHAWWKQW